MAKRISKQDATGDFPSALDELKAKFGSLDTAIHASDELVKMFKTDLGKLRKEIAGIDMGSVKGIKEFNAKQKDAQKIMLDTAKLEQQNIKLLQEKEKLKQQELRTQKLLNTEKKKTLTAYQLESKALNEMRDRYKHLAVQKMNGVKLTKDEEKEYRRLIPQIRQTDAALKKIDARAGQFQRNVGNYPKVLNGFKNALGQLGLTFGIFQTLRVAKDALVDFEEGAADIAKTTGLTTENAKKLSTELLNFDTKTSVSELQGLTAAAGSLNVEGKSNILDFVENADKAFVALGDDLGGTSQEIATNVGKITGVFGDEKEFGIGQAINKVGSSINDLAGKSKAAAAPILDFTQRVAGLGNIIKSYDAAALGAFFDEGGQSVEVAASTLNTLLPKLATDYKKFAKVAGLSAEEFKKLAENSPIEALKAVANGAKNSEKGLFNLSKTVQSFGVDSARATSIVGYLANNTDRLTELQKISNEAYEKGTSLTDEFNKKNQTLGANIEKVTKEFLKYAIGMDRSGNISGKFSSTLKFLASNMQSILTVAKEALIVFTVYKSRVIAINVAQKLFGNSAGKMNISMKQLVTNFKDSSAAGKGFANSLKGGIWAAAIAGVIELSLELYKAAKGFYLMKQHAQEFKNIFENPSNKELDRFLKSIDDQVKVIRDLRKAKKISAEDEKKQIEEAISLHQKQTNERIKSLRLDKSIALTALKAEEESYKKSPNVKTKQTIIDLNGAIRLYSEQIEKLKYKVGETDGVQEGFNGTLDDGEGKVKKLNTQLKEQNEYLSKQKDLLHELGQAYVEFDIEDISDRIELLKEKTFDLARETGNIDNEALKEAITERMQAQESSIDSILIYEIEAIRERYRIEKEEARRAIEDNRTELLSQKDLTDSERLKIEKDYQEKLRKLNEDNKQRDEDRDTEISIKESKASRDKIKLKKDTSKELEDIEKQTIEKIEEFNTEEEAKQLKRSQELDELEAKKLKERYENQKKWIELTTKLWEDNIDKKIALLDKESEAHKNQYDYFQGLAESGNINAQQSLAEEARLQREAEKEKAKLEQRKLYIQAFSAFMTNYTNRLENGENSTEALAGAVADKAVLEAILATLPAFYEGTESTGKTSNPLDSNGGRVALLHDNERVLTAKQNKPLLDMGISNPDIVKYVQMGVIAESIESGDRAGNSFDIKPLLEKFDKLEKTIQNLPQVDYQYDKAIDGLFTVIKTTKRGNLTTRTETQFRPR